MPAVLACLYDVHGNLPALEAVLDDARAAGATRYVLGGDYALMGGWPVEMRRAPARAPRRDLDPRQRRPLDRRPARRRRPSARPPRRARRRSAPAGWPRSANLPERAQVADWMVVHASPGSDLEGFAPAADATDAELIGGGAFRPRKLMFGHTHVQFLRDAGGVTLLNPGSVGMPLDGDRRAAYALIDGDDVELRRVEYDWEAARRAGPRVRGRRAVGGGRRAGRIERAAFG